MLQDVPDQPYHPLIADFKDHLKNENFYPIFVKILKLRYFLNNKYLQLINPNSTPYPKFTRSNILIFTLLSCEKSAIDR